MADQIPVKANLTSGVATSLAQFAVGDTVPVANGGTGAATAASARTALGVAQDGPRFRAYPGTSPTIANNTIAQIGLDTETFDPSSTFNTSTYRFTPNVAGYYAMSWAVGFTNVSAVTLSLAIGILRKNGTEVSRTHLSVPASQQAAVQGSDLVYFNGTTDYVELYGYATISSGTLVVQGSNGGNYTFLAGHYIGP